MEIFVAKECTVVRVPPYYCNQNMICIQPDNRTITSAFVRPMANQYIHTTENIIVDDSSITC